MQPGSPADSSLLNLLPQHQEILKARAIGDDIALARGYRSVGKAEARDLGFTGVQARPGLLIPLWRVDGKPGGYQLRPDEPRIAKGGKLIKYETPKRQRNVLDMPPTVRDELHKGRQAVLITEGAFKADALASLHIPCINLAGVYGWRGRNEDDGYTALSDWEMVNIRGNIFVLAFDSDILTKPKVHRALARLKRFLEGRGALYVRVLVLPHLLSGKTGIDDYIATVNATAEDLARLVVDDLPFQPDAVPQAQTEPPPDLAPLLDQIVAFYHRFVVITPPQADALALWTAHTHAISAAETTPYINISSPEKESGKTRTGEVATLLVAKPLAAESISPAALARSIDVGVTLILDEIDTIFGKGRSAPSETSELLRGVLDSGWRLGGRYVRMVGQGANMAPQAFSTFGAKMLIGIGTIPGTLISRSVRIELRRRRDMEPIERFRIRKATPEGHTLQAQLAAWASAHLEELRVAEPILPEVLSDRLMDSWEPLIAIADLAGGEWPLRARKAAVALCGEEVAEDETTGVKLLSDLRDLFQGEPLSTVTILEYLNRIEESPWGTWNQGNGMRAQDLARTLKPFSIRPKTIRVASDTMKGYNPADFQDAFTRYISSAVKNAVIPSQPYLDQLVTADSQNGHSSPNVTDDSQIGASYECDGVTAKMQGKGTGEDRDNELRI